MECQMSGKVWNFDTEECNEDDRLMLKKNVAAKAVHA